MKHKHINSRTPRNEAPGYHAPQPATSKAGGGYPANQPFTGKKE